MVKKKSKKSSEKKPKTFLQARISKFRKEREQTLKDIKRQKEELKKLQESKKLSKKEEKRFEDVEEGLKKSEKEKKQLRYERLAMVPERRLASLREKFRTPEEQKTTTKRARGVRELLKVTGIISGPASQTGRGRPRGTYKYGVPIHIYKRQLAEKKALYQKYQQEQEQKLRPQGFTPEQVQQLQQTKTIQEIQSRQPQQVRQPRRIQPPIQIFPQRSVADEELDFRRWSAESTISPNTQRMLDHIRRIQLKGQRDNIDQQRRHRERIMVGRSMNMFRAHENMTPTQLDFTGVEQENILMAPSVFRENPENNILRTNRFNIMQTKEAGHNLKFF